ncbi:TIR domain-containing protein [Oscillatoria sp. CS-180]|uniref:TIR domain-containing protein n=1 Tax=Oscillatoria sp. CS-180 TaxID=3021720 RepID=UPI00232E6F50|nr:TIR domain-containing protein [Oscillatoria sp. CS-180]MDB9529068.1 TIR domain-containing protein [Oscillatoria sp. CS-180]
MSVEVFFSYSHKDEDLRDELEKHLKLLQRQGKIDAWYDRDIEAGAERLPEIQQHLNQADIILLLVSADFLASDYCYDVEVKRAMERHEAREARVIPVILRPVDWQDAPFGQLKPLPTDGQPIAKWANQDEALLNVAQGIKHTLQEVAAARAEFKTNLYSALLKLGFQQQAELFLRAIDAESVAAFLIHGGSPEYGQRWLLNRLVVEYVPLHTVSKVVTIDLSRTARRKDVSAYWRELGKRLNLKLSEINAIAVADGVYRWWLTQDVIFVFHDVNLMPESSLVNLIEQFWLPLTQRVQMAEAGESDRKLLMFFVDYEGKAEQWQLPWVEKLDASWDPRKPIKPPKLQEFTDQEVMSWIVSQFRDLPPVLTQGIDEQVNEILALTDQGVPDLVLQEICERCGFDWYEELDKWLKY